MIKQLQANQLALTQGLNQNTLAITEAFDKMDEVKRWEMRQLPGFPAIKDSQEKTEDKEEMDEKEEKGTSSSTKKFTYDPSQNFTDEEHSYLEKNSLCSTFKTIGKHRKFKRSKK